MMINKKIVILFGILFLLAIGGALFSPRHAAQPSPQPPAPVPSVCPQDLKLCPDGSSVGRTSPNCEFATCPEPTAKVRVITIKEAKEELSMQLLSEDTGPEGVVGVGLGKCDDIDCILVFLENNSPELRAQIPTTYEDYLVSTRVSGAICTQDAKLCPGGSIVGRVPPSCDFAPCP